MVQPEQAAAQAAVSLQIDRRPVSPPGFEEFYRTAWRPLVRTAMLYGATLPEAEDAASQALAYMLSRWPINGYPLAYAKKATLSYFFRARKRTCLQAARHLIIKGGHVPHHEGAEDGRLADLEGAQWLAEVLSQLTQAQREVMELIAEGLSYQDIAGEIGKSDEVVRRRVADARARLTKILAPDGMYLQSRPAQARTSREEAR